MTPQALLPTALLAVSCLTLNAHLVYGHLVNGWRDGMHAATIPEQVLHTTVKFSRILPPAPRLTDVTLKLKPLMLVSMKKSGKSHEQVAAELSVALGHKVSARMLYRFTAPSEQASFPAAWVAAFCEVTGDDALKRLILGPQLCELLELGERAAAILDDRARRQLINVPGNGIRVKRNGSGSCAR